MSAPVITPMELRLVETIPDGPDWLYEPKWDGFRCIAHRDGETVQLVSKTGQPLARYFPEIVADLAHIAADRFSLDGELVVPAGGALSFETLQARIHPAASRVALLSRTTPAYFLAFDLLREDTPLLEDSLRDRRPRLESFAARHFKHGRIRLSPASTDRTVVDAWFARVGTALDGVVAKRLDLAYAGGTREGGVKVKQIRSADCVVGGFRFAAGCADRVGSFLLGLYDANGQLDYVGFCSAFTTAERHALVARLQPFVGGSGFTGNAPGDAPSRWSRDPQRDRSYIALAPELVVEIAFDQASGGRIRHGTRLLRWRTDKAPLACTRDQIKVAATALTLLDIDEAAATTDHAQEA